MKTGRNDPCPCGSGKKYKKCCYFTKESTGDESLLVPLDDIPGPPDESGFKEQEALLRGIVKARMFLLGSKPHIKEYNKARKMHGEILDDMVFYNEDGKFERRIDPNSTPQDIRGKTVHLLESDFDFNTETGIQAVYDIFIYKSARNMTCITEDFIRDNRYKNPEKMELLHSMLQSRLGLFEVTGTKPEEGLVNIKDVFTGDEYTMTDIGLSGEPNYDNIYLYTRIITHRGIIFGTGLNFLFYKTDSFITKHIQEHKKDFEPNAEFVRFTQLYNQFSKDAKGFRVLTQS